MEKMAHDGFTLIEIIATLVLVGILTVTVGLFVVTGLNSYFSSKDAGESALAARIAFQRIGKELGTMDVVKSIVTDTSIQYTSSDKDLRGTREIRYDSAAQQIYLNVGGTDHLLLDSVKAFKLRASTADMDGNGSSDIADIDVGITLSDNAPVLETWIYPRTVIPWP